MKCKQYLSQLLMNTIEYYEILYRVCNQSFLGLLENNDTL